MLELHDRVRRPAAPWKVGETDRFGNVVEVYNGVRSAVDDGVPLCAIKWDDGEVTRGHFRQGGNIQRIISVPTVWTPERVLSAEEQRRLAKGEDI